MPQKAIRQEPVISAMEAAQSQKTKMKIETCPRHKNSRSVENVLILQGGGSLGAFGCGVFKALYKEGVRFDIVGGTSIGAVNGAIICGSRNDEDPAKNLEEFWTEIAENSYRIIPDMLIPTYNPGANRFQIDKVPSSILNAVFFGVPGFFVPRWWQQPPWFGGAERAEGAEGDGAMNDGDGRKRKKENEIMTFFSPADWTYYYDHSPLARTLEKYVDFGKLSKKRGQSAEENVKKDTASSTPRLIATAVNLLTAEALVFDSAKMQIKPKHILASAAYSAYGFPWIEVDKGVYAWDGSLLSNTPLKEVIECSPVNDKNIYLVENYPRKIRQAPRSRAEVVDRTRDVIFSDKTVYDIRAWKHISRQNELIEKLYDILENHADIKAVDPLMLEDVRREYESLVGRYGAEILAIHRISRSRMDSPHILKNADFSPSTIKDLIAQGETKVREHFGGADEAEMAELIELLYT